MVMERLEGEQLEALIYRNARLAWDRIRRIIYEVGSALHYAHARGLIHRDVKPSNIFLTKKGPAKLLDFGIAVVSEHSNAENKARLGSPCYMPPEQILGKALDGRADLYALGMTAYEMIVGEVPFNEYDIRALLKRQLYERTPDILDQVHDCPSDLVEFIRTATEKTPESRFGDIAAALNILKRNPPSSPLIQAERVKLVIHHGLESTDKVDEALEKLYATLKELGDVSVQIKRS
jgi:serine/threonine-protein kinase